MLSYSSPMHKKVATTCVILLSCSSAAAFDNGPQVVGCDYRLNKQSEMQADTCFLPMTGTQMGYTTVIVRPGNSKLFYRFEDNYGSLDSTKWRKAKIQTGSRYDSKSLWSGTFRYSNKQCRPGGANSSVYDLSNGAKFCLYFDNN